jgi:hypothetical protein
VQKNECASHAPGCSSVQREFAASCKGQASTQAPSPQRLRVATGRRVLSVRAYRHCQWAPLRSFSIARRAAARPPRLRPGGLARSRWPFVDQSAPAGPGGSFVRGAAPKSPLRGPAQRPGGPVPRAGWGRRCDRGALHRPGPSLSRRGTRAGAAPAPFVLKHTPRGLSAEYGTMRVRLVEAPC